MLNSPFIKKWNTNLLRDINKLLFENKRYYADLSKHHDPPDLSWQWTPKNCAAPMDCPIRCTRQECPKRSFFPRFKKAYIPAPKSSCKSKKGSAIQRAANYFSFLLPDNVQEARKRKQMESCRLLAAVRRKCTDPMEWDCCRTSMQPREWYTQGVVHVIITDDPFSENGGQDGKMKKTRYDSVVPCPPPSYMVPRCVQAKRGNANPPKVEPSSTRCLPYQEVAAKGSGDADGGSDSAPSSPSQARPYKFKKKNITSIIIPPVLDRESRLKCRTYTEFKTVECPAQLYSKFKPVCAIPVSCRKRKNPKGEKKEKADSETDDCIFKSTEKSEKSTKQPPGCPNKKCKYHTWSLISNVNSSTQGAEEKYRRFHTLFCLKEMKAQDPNSPTCPKKECPPPEDEEPPAKPPEKEEDEEEEVVKVVKETKSCVKLPPFDPHAVERQSCSCFSKPVKRAKKGILCSLAGVFGIGCGKKCFKKYH